MLNADAPAIRACRAEGSTGLGLSISRELARVMNGELALVPQSLLGRLFQLSIPSKTWDKSTQPQGGEGPMSSKCRSGMERSCACSSQRTTTSTCCTRRRSWTSGRCMWMWRLTATTRSTCWKRGVTTSFCWTCKCPTWTAWRRFVASEWGTRCGEGATAGVHGHRIRRRRNPQGGAKSAGNKQVFGQAFCAE